MISLESIRSGTSKRPPKIVIYGPPGVGKTTFAAGAPNPIFLFTEDGQGMLDVASFAPDGDPTFQSFADVLEALGALYEDEHDFETVVIDSLDSLEPMMQAEFAAAHGKENIEDFGYGKGFKMVLEYANNLLAWLDALRSEKGMNVIVVAHTVARRFDDPTTESYDQFDLGVDKWFSKLVHHWADAVLFANYDTKTVTKKDGMRERTRAVGRGERMLFAEKRSGFLAKNRFRLPWKMKLDWSEFAESIGSSADGESQYDEEPEDEQGPETTTRASASRKKKIARKKKPADSVEQD